MFPPSFRPADLHEQRFTVSFGYPVSFCEDALAPSDPTLAWSIARGRRDARDDVPPRHPVFAIVDGGLAAAQPDLLQRLATYVAGCGELLELRGTPAILPGGEDAKNDPRLIERLYEDFARARLDRHAVVLAVGGGAVLDAAGYAAATAHRGLRLVRMPSTVLAQADGGVGVKNGVNALGFKNFVGSFAPPYAVVNDAALLRTLPLREARAGMAEAVKVALIRDRSFFDWLEANADALARAEGAAVHELVRRAAEIHLGHIAQGGDPFELGSARPLDYGHWAAHKLEVASRHQLRHGEAVAIGMLLDARYAERTGLLAAADLARIVGLLAALGLPRYHPVLSERRSGRLTILAGLDEFREHLGGPLTLTLLTGIGQSREVHAIDDAVVAEAIAWLAAAASDGEGKAP